MRKLSFIAASVVMGLGLAACAPERSENVPADAQVVTEGTDQLSYRAPYDGVVYVWDASKNQVVYSGNVMRGQLVTVDPRNDVIKLDNQMAAEKTLNGGSRYKIYFRQNRMGQ